MKLRGRKFQFGAIGPQLRVEGEGEYLIHDAICRRIKKVYADAMSVLVRRGGPLSKMAAHPATVSVTKVTVTDAESWNWGNRNGLFLMGDTERSALAMRMD